MERIKEIKERRRREYRDGIVYMDRRGMEYAEDATEDFDYLLDNIDPDIAAKDAEIARLTECLSKANAQTEEYERRYYLEKDKSEGQDAEIAALSAREDELNALCLDYKIDLDSAHQEVAALKRERDALLKVREALPHWTEYDGTPETLPPEGLYILVESGLTKGRFSFLYRKRHLIFEIGDRWMPWPTMGGGE